MPTAAQKIHSSTQKFTQILDVVDSVVISSNGMAASIIEVRASNFSLLSKVEQESKIYSYAAFLNSLTFPVQILIRNKRIDISSYLKELAMAQATTPNPLLAKQIQLYRNFVAEMVKTNVILNKTFYIVLSYSALEAGLSGIKSVSRKGSKEYDNFVRLAKASLQSKIDILLSQIKRFTQNSVVLDRDEIIKLLYDIFNGQIMDASQIGSDTSSPMIKSTL